ncbi:MAG: ABC transporter permease [Vicinamibacterales bacterium]
MKRALSRLLRTPAFTLTASASLALAVGANTAIFSIVNALWLRPLPVRDAATLVVPYYPVVHSADGEVLERTTLPNAMRLGSLTSFDGVTFQLSTGARTEDWRPVMREAARALPIAATAVAANYFDVLGVSVRGRTFRPEEDVAGAAPAVIISERLGRQLSGGTRFPVGTAIATTKGLVPVIGVAAESFHGPRLGDQFDLWTTIGALGSFSDMAVDPGMREFTPVTVFARLRSGITLATAQAEARTVLDRRTTLRSLRDVAFPLRSEGGLARQRALVRTLWSGALLVLVLGAVNLAALFLGRAADRRHQFAVRLSLGSTRTALIGDVLTEVLVLSCLGLAAGLLFRQWLLGSVSALETASGLPIAALDVSLDWRVAIFGAAVTLVAAAITAIAAAGQAARADVSVVLAATAAQRKAGHGLARQVFLAAHVALSVTLLVVAFALVATVRGAFAADLGFARDRTILVSVRPRLTQFMAQADDTRARVLSYRATMHRLRALPFVTAVTYGDLPYDPAREPSGAVVVVDGRERRLRWVQVRAGGGYVTASGAVLEEGRDLTDADTRNVPTRLEMMRDRSLRRQKKLSGPPPFGGRSPAVIDRALATTLWPQAPALGRMFKSNLYGLTYEVVGVVERFGPLGAGQIARPTLIAPVPIETYDGIQTLHLVIGTKDSPSRHLEDVSSLLREAFPDASRLEVTTAIDAVARNVAQERMGARVFGWYAATACALGLLGIYGLLAFFIAATKRELGIRSALGAPAASMIRMMAARVLAPVTLGVLGGVLLSWALGRGLATFIVGLDDVSAGVYAMASASFFGAGVVVIGVGAREIRRVNPAEILRSE